MAFHYGFLRFDRVCVQNFFWLTEVTRGIVQILFIVVLSPIRLSIMVLFEHRIESLAHYSSLLCIR